MTRTEGRNAYLDHIEHGDKLREHEHLVSPFKKGFKEPLEGRHLPTRIDELLVHDRVTRLRVERPVKQEWVRAHFAQLHYDVLKMHVVDLLHCGPPESKHKHSSVSRVKTGVQKGAHSSS